MSKSQLRHILVILFPTMFGFFLTSCTVEDISPTSTDVIIFDSATTTTLEFDFQEPSVPVVGGKGLPETDIPADAEIDCEDAENLCEEGIYACDDIADYCDYGPDGGELPDEFDWDK